MSIDTTDVSVRETGPEKIVTSVKLPDVARTGGRREPPVVCGAASGRVRILFPPERKRNVLFTDRLFPLILAATVLLCIGIGFIARSIPPVRQTISRSLEKIRTEFHLSEEQRFVEPPKPIVEKKKPVRDEKPVDLTEKPKEPAPSDVPPEEKRVEPPSERKPVRKVFGLRRVYSTGLGSGGSMSDAVVGKIGNTINKEYDTIAATESDLKGIVVSTATVTSAPRFRKIVRPEYTKEMIDRKIEGTVKVKILIDIDGRVKKATCLNDIGFDSASEAVKATLSMEFEPAMRGSEPVAVWIIIPIKFVLLG
jgi:protein TonB